MEKMKINGINLEQYHAKLLDYVPGGTAVTNHYNLGYRSLSPVLLDTEVALKTLSVTLTIQGQDRQEAAEYLSMLNKVLYRESELEMPDGYLYFCILTGISEAAHTSEGLCDVTYTFDAVQRLPLVTAALESKSEQTFYCQGEVACECRLTITAPQDLEAFTINGLTIQNLEQDVPVVVDGLKKLVTQAGENKFQETNLVDFPRLEPGQNTFTLSDATVAVQVEYYPTFL